MLPGTDRLRAGPWVVLSAALGLAGWSAAHTAPVGRLAAPARLADTGLYAEFASRTLAPRVLPFEPQYPLWTDGATKRRWIRLPSETAIDASDPDAWVFPIGTQLWKEFSFDRRVETRYMERGADGRWIYATYVWSADESDAVLAPARGLRSVCESVVGLRHDIPSRADCLVCHEGQPSPVLGFTALQLSPDRDPLAPHAATPERGAVDLRWLLDRKLVRGLPAELCERPPRIEAPTPQARAALGYLASNCGVCHNARGPLAGLGLALDYPLGARDDATPPALRTALGQPSRFRLPDEQASARLEPGDPEKSVLFRRMSARATSAQMPPLGSHAQDTHALELVRAWIREDLRPEPLARR